MYLLCLKFAFQKQTLEIGFFSHSFVELEAKFTESLLLLLIATTLTLAETHEHGVMKKIRNICICKDITSQTND